MGQSKIERGWIWLWYNDITRLCVLTGVPSLLIVFICFLLFGSGEYLRIIAGFSYVVFFVWASVDNDYSKLRRIGMTEFRRKI